MHNLSLALQGGLNVLLVGLVLGAGLPALFALGIRSMALGTGSGSVGDGQPHPVGKVLAAVCFGIVLAAIALGITFVVASGFGKAVSFEHVFPTLVDKP